MGALAIPEEMVLATRFELGVGDRAALSDLVDRRVAAVDRVEGALLELATPFDRTPDELAELLRALTLASHQDAARMKLIVTAQLVDEGIVSLERAVDYLSVRVAHELGPPLDARCIALDDILWQARAGRYWSDDDVRAAIREIAGTCAAQITSA